MVKLTQENAKSIYYEMQLARKFEDKCTQLYGMGYIAGFLHLYNGQEAVSTGINFLRTPADSNITSYRCHAHALGHGKIEPKLLLAELTGRVTGCSKGKGGSMHVYSKANKFYGGNGIVGGQVPLGTGIALAHKYNKDKGVCFTFYGDGASSQGQVYESFNMATLWQLPIIFIIENNHYSMGTPIERTTASPDFSARANAFNIPSLKVNGMDVLDVIEKTEKALQHVRGGKGPFFLEVDTYRYKGHSMSDPQKYRNRSEVDQVREQKDPIIHFEEYAVKKKLLTKEDVKSMNDKVKKVIAEAEEFALSSPEPAPTDLYTHILV